MTRLKALLMATTLAGVVGAAALAPSAYAQVATPAAPAAPAQVAPATPPAPPQPDARAPGRLAGLACKADADRLAGRLDQLSTRLGLTAEQTPLFDAYRTAALTAQTGFADACATIAAAGGAAPDALTAMQNRLAIQTAEVDALTATLPSFEAFFTSLTDAQKALLTPMGRHGQDMGQGGPNGRQQGGPIGGQPGGRQDGHGGNAGMPQGGRHDNRDMGQGGRNDGGFRHGGPVMPGAIPPAPPVAPQAAPVAPVAPAAVAPVPAA